MWKELPVVGASLLLIGYRQRREVQIFSKITSALLGCIWGEIFFRKSYLRGVRGDEIRG